MRIGIVGFVSGVLAVAGIVAACGSTSPNRSSHAVSNNSGSASSDSVQTRVHDQSVVFSRCVRTHGVSNFPDPPTNGGYGLKSFAQQSNGQTMSINGVSVNGPAFRSAMAKCDKYLPQHPAPTRANLEQQRVAAVRFGRCMRAHRIDIPDPKVASRPGGIGVQVYIPSGMTQNSPAFVAADQECARTSGFGSPPQNP
jgi:hypothetical protein